MMNKVFFAILAVSTALSGSAAFAGQGDDLVARLNAAEQENAAIRKTNLEFAAAQPARPASMSDRMADFFGVYAADLPLAYKARPIVEPGRLTLWGEAGAIWTGGDTVSRAVALVDFTRSSGDLVNGSGAIFDLTPKIGWEAATGFDYKFAGSPWHVSGQFRYGEGGKTSGNATSAGGLDPSVLNMTPSCLGFNQGELSACGGSQTLTESYKETHWLSDLALGYDIVSGPSYVQVKGGLRIEEFVAQSIFSSTTSIFANYSFPTSVGPSGPMVNSLGATFLSTQNIRDNFLGAGPLIGLEGSARFMGAWSFDYKGDLAVLFGTQTEFEKDITRTTSTPALLGIVNSRFSGGSASASTNAARFVTMLSPDIQVGVSYWFTPNIKLGLSYRVDGLIAVKNQKSANADDLILPQRYWHGPRLTLSGTFDSN